MAAEPLSYMDVVKAALWKPVQTRLLGAMPVTQMLLVGFGLAGFVNPGFWLLGVGAAVAWVGGRSSSERFQRLLQAQRIAARTESAEVRMQKLFDRLQPASQSRYRALVMQCREILGLGGTDSDGSPTDIRAGNLNQLLWLFLRLLASREGIQDTMARVDRRQLEANIEALKGRLAAVPDADSALGRSLKATFDIQEKRLANLDNAVNSLAVIDAELERIETQVRLVREESAVSASPDALSARLDAVSSTLSDTSRWMDQHAELFTDMASADFDSSVPDSLGPANARRRRRAEDATADPAASPGPAPALRYRAEVRARPARVNRRERVTLVTAGRPAGGHVGRVDPRSCLRANPGRPGDAEPRDPAPAGLAEPPGASFRRALA